MKDHEEQLIALWRFNVHAFHELIPDDWGPSEAIRLAFHEAVARLWERGFPTPMAVVNELMMAFFLGVVLAESNDDDIPQAFREAFGASAEK